VRAVEAVVEMLKSTARRDPLVGVETNRPFPRLRFTNEQWNEISNLSGIPKNGTDARKSIEIALGMFRQFQATDLRLKPPAKIRKEFCALAEDAKNLYKRLSDLVSDRDAYTALTGEISRLSPLDRLRDIADRQASPSNAEAQPLMQDGHRYLSKIRDVLLDAPKRFLIA
jgi:hypothetical protein